MEIRRPVTVFVDQCSQLRLIKIRQKGEILSQKSPNFAGNFLQKCHRQYNPKNRPIGENSPRLGTLEITEITEVKNKVEPN